MKAFQRTSLTTLSRLPTPSPCIGLCHLNDATGLCEGCYRSLQEIALWSGFNEADRRAVLGAVEERKRQMQGKGD